MPSMDRGQDWIQALESSCRQMHVPEATLRSLKASVLMRSKPKQGAFMQAALAVLATVGELRDFITLHQEGYQGTGVYSESDKDQIEMEVSSLVKECTASVEKLKTSVLAAAAAAAAAEDAWDSDVQGSSAVAGRHVNGQTTAHRHGVVLSLAEQLGAVTARFDRCRASRYQRLTDVTNAQPGPPLSASQRGRGNGQAGGADGAGRGWGGAASASASALLGRSGNVAMGKVAKLGGVMLGRVKGVREAVMKGGAGWGAEAQDADGQGAGGRGGAMTQQQLLLEEENRDLVAQLSTTAFAVHGVERTVREIATLNQLFSAAVLHQAAAIETLYDDAVQSSKNIKQGNKEIQLTVAVNRSTQKYILALLLAASLGLLFLDWFNS